MNVATTALALFLFNSLSAFAQAPDVASWKSGTPALHTPVRNQGDVGFCWANAFASYLESKMLIEQGKTVDLSAMYSGRAHMAEGYVDTLNAMTSGPMETKGAMSVLSRYQELRKDPISLSVTKQFITRKLQDYAEDRLEGFFFSRAYQYGAVPASVYEKPAAFPTHILPFPGAVPPYDNRYFDPEHEYKFTDFVANHLMNEDDMARYLSEDGVNEIERDFDRDIGNTPISENDTFEFEGKSYTPHTFLLNYIGYKQSEVMIQNKYAVANSDNFDESIAAIQSELDQQRPVLFSMTILDDPESKYATTGLMDVSNCADPEHCYSEGGHAVMVVNSMKDADGNVKALIIQNSWGPQGTDDKGVFTKERAVRGFNIVTLDYLREAISLRGFAFRYQKI